MQIGFQFIKNVFSSVLIEWKYYHYCMFWVWKETEGHCRGLSYCTILSR